MTSERRQLRWGVVGCGWISAAFVGDLVLHRTEATASHTVQAIGSSTIEKGKEFASRNCPNETPAIYDSYQGVYNDPNVDVVYIGTPHVFHCQNALDAIEAGKHVLCEKPLAINERDARRMIEAAKAKGVFLMEAVWTRFFPIAKRLQSLLHVEKVIGDIVNVKADFSKKKNIAGASGASRAAAKALGASALLDIGIYSLIWASIALDLNPKRNSKVVPDLSASMIFHDESDSDGKFDEQTTIVLRYPDLKAQAICSASILAGPAGQFCTVMGTKGSISVGGMAASRPGYLLLNIDGEEEQRLDFEIPGFGFHWEADAVAEDVQAGRLENSTCPHESTLLIMSRMDAAREQCGLTFPQDN